MNITFQNILNFYFLNLLLWLTEQNTKKSIKNNNFVLNFKNYALKCSLEGIYTNK